LNSFIDAGCVTAAFRDVAAKWTDSLVTLAAAATPAARASWQASVDTAYGAGVSVIIDESQV